MSDNNIEMQKTLFEEQSQMFESDIEDISQQDREYINSRMMTAGEQAERELQEYQEVRKRRRKEEKRFVVAEGVTDLVDLEAEALEVTDKVSRQAKNRIEANKVRVVGIKHSKMLNEARKKLVQDNGDGILQRNVNQEKISELSQRVTNVDGTGNFDAVKGLFNELIVKLAVLRTDPAAVSLEQAEELKASYTQALTRAREYVDSHSFWKFKAVVPWGIGRKRKNMAENIVRDLERGALHDEIKNLVPWLDGETDKSEDEELTEEIIKKDVVEREYVEYADKHAKDMSKRFQEMQIKSPTR